MSNFIKDIWLQLIKEDKIEEALNSIEDFMKASSDEELLYELLAINNNYAELKKSIQLGLINDIRFSSRKNSVLRRIIDFVNEIDAKYGVANKTYQFQTKEISRLSNSVDLKVKLSRNFEKYSLLNFKTLFDYIRSKSEQGGIHDRNIVRIIDFSPGSVNVVFEMSYDSFQNLMRNLDREEFFNLGINEMELVEYARKNTSIYNRKIDQDFSLQKLKAGLKVKISESLKKGLLEVKRVLNPDSELFNDFIVNYSRFNSNKLNRKFNNHDDFIRTENQIVNDLLQLIDRIREEDIDKNAT